MNRAFLGAVILLALGATALAEPAVQIVEAQCFDDGTVVGATSDFGLAILKDDGWQPFSVEKGVNRLWRSPDGRIFAIAFGGDPWAAVQVREDPGPFMRWKIPTDSGAMRFASLDGVDVVTHDRMYRLDAGGRLTDVGATPVGGNGQPLYSRAPEILVSGATAIVCVGESHQEEDNVGGSCREARGAYLYLVNFEELSDVRDPFVCGDVVISAAAHLPPTDPRERTQARALATGRLLGRTAGAPRRGSACLDGKRALLVGKRDLRVVSVPGLRLLWRQKITREIGTVAVCGGTRAVVIPRGSPFPVEVFNLDAPRGRSTPPPS